MNAIITLCEQSGAVSRFLLEQAGSGQVAILEKDELRPKRVFNSLRKLRRLKVENLYFLVRDVTKQHNSFYLKLICLLSGAKSRFFRDGRGEVEKVTTRFSASGLARALRRSHLHGVHLCFVLLCLACALCPREGQTSAARRFVQGKAIMLSKDRFLVCFGGGRIRHTYKGVY